MVSLKSAAECVRSNAGYSLAVLISSIMLVIALSDLPYGYYTLLRVVVCAVASYGAFKASEVGKMAWTWMMGTTAFIFNPLIPLHLDRETWALVDLAVALLLPASIKGVYSPDEAPTPPMQDHHEERQTIRKR